MKIQLNIKILLLFCIIIQLCYCQENTGKKDDTEKPSEVNPGSTTEQPVTTDPPQPPPTTTTTTTTTIIKPEPTTNKPEPTQNPITKSQTDIEPTNNYDYTSNKVVPTGIINNSTDINADNLNSEDKDNIPTFYLIISFVLVVIIVIAVIGIAILFKRKKSNGDEPLTTNMWAVPGDFDSRVIPVSTPATVHMDQINTSAPQYMNQSNYNMKPIMAQPILNDNNNYSPKPIVTDSYQNQKYADVTEAQQIDNTYSTDYSMATPMAQNMEYIPTSIDELTPNTVYVSQFTFQPELEDEIEINIDDQVYIEEIFADNWALGFNKNNNCRGCFPLNIFLNPKSTLDNSRSIRTLSYCSNGNSGNY